MPSATATSSVRYIANDSFSVCVFMTAEYIRLRCRVSDPATLPGLTLDILDIRHLRILSVLFVDRTYASAVAA